jgi:hypothetical protein
MSNTFSQERDSKTEKLALSTILHHAELLLEDPSALVSPWLLDINTHRNEYLRGTHRAGFALPGPGHAYGRPELLASEWLNIGTEISDMEILGVGLKLYSKENKKEDDKRKKIIDPIFVLEINKTSGEFQSILYENKEEENEKEEVDDDICIVDGVLFEEEEIFLQEEKEEKEKSTTETFELTNNTFVKEIDHPISKGISAKEIEVRGCGTRSNTLQSQYSASSHFSSPDKHWVLARGTTISKKEDGKKGQGKGSSHNIDNDVESIIIVKKVG